MSERFIHQSGSRRGLRLAGCALVSLCALRSPSFEFEVKRTPLFLFYTWSNESNQKIHYFLNVVCKLFNMEIYSTI